MDPLVVGLNDEPADGSVELGKREDCLAGTIRRPFGCVPRQLAKAQLVDAEEEAFDLAAAPGLSRLGEDQLNLQIRSDLLDMRRGEI